MQHVRPNRPLEPDPLGDALADCYDFLLARLAAKRAAQAQANTIAQVDTPAATDAQVASPSN
jgi:hypothetical protein